MITTLLLTLALPSADWGCFGNVADESSPLPAATAHSPTAGNPVAQTLVDSSAAQPLDPGGDEAQGGGKDSPGVLTTPAPLLYLASNCPSGNCPTSTRRMSNTPGFRLRLRAAYVNDSKPLADVLSAEPTTVREAVSTYERYETRRSVRRAPRAARAFGKAVFAPFRFFGRLFGGRR